MKFNFFKKNQQDTEAVFAYNSGFADGFLSMEEEKKELRLKGARRRRYLNVSNNTRR